MLYQIQKEQEHLKRCYLEEFFSDEKAYDYLKDDNNFIIISHEGEILAFLMMIIKNYYKEINLDLITSLTLEKLFPNFNIITFLLHSDFEENYDYFNFLEKVNKKNLIIENSFYFKFFVANLLFHLDYYYGIRKEIGKALQGDKYFRQKEFVFSRIPLMNSIPNMISENDIVRFRFDIGLTNSTRSFKELLKGMGIKEPINNLVETVCSIAFPSFDKEFSPASLDLLFPHEIKIRIEQDLLIEPLENYGYPFNERNSYYLSILYSLFLYIYREMFSPAFKNNLVIQAITTLFLAETLFKK
jgi:hypothetical protein